MANRQPTPSGPPSKPVGKPLEVTPVGEPEPKTRKKQKVVLVGIFESVSIQEHGIVWKPVRDESGKGKEFKSTAKADKWLKDSAEEGDNDKVFLIAPLRKVTVKATKQLKVALEF